MFREDPPSEACAKAVQKLTELVKKCEVGRYLDPVKDLKINDIDYVHMLNERKGLECSIQLEECIQCPAFEDHVRLGHNSYFCLYIYIHRD